MIARLAILPVLWLPFSIASLVAVAVTLFVILFGDKEQQQGYGKNVLRAMDKVLAAVCGFGGYYTFSAELAFATWPPFVAVRWVLDKIQAGHCLGAAKNENHPLTRS